MRKALVVVDMQKDFIDGVLGSEQAKAVVPAVREKIRSWDGEIFFTMDTHSEENYSVTTEGKSLPILHCVRETDGWQLHPDIHSALVDKVGDYNKLARNGFAKKCFGSPELATAVYGSGATYVEVVGLCTDVCVISNAVMIRNQNPYIRVAVDASCCAGVTPESHRTALEAMKGCGIQVIND